MTDFHKTSLGQMFYGKHIPEMVKELRRIADGLEKANKMMIKESKLTKKAEIKDKIKDVKELDKLEEDASKTVKVEKKANYDPDLDLGDE